MADLRRLALPLVALLAACGPRNGTDAGDTGGDAGDAGGDIDVAEDVVATSPSVRFAVPATGVPDPLDVPFPSDLYRTGPGGTIALPDHMNVWRNVGVTRNPQTLTYGLNGLDGFGRNTGAMFLLDGADGVDPASLPADGAASRMPGSSVFMVELDGPSAGTRVPVVASYIAPTRTLVVQPDAAVLAPGRRYAVVLTAGVRIAGGQALGASPTFAAIRDNAAGARDSAAGTLYGTAVDRVLELSGGMLERGAIAGVAVFTSHSADRFLRATHAALVAGRYGPPPQLITTQAMVSAPFNVVRFGATMHPGWTSTLDAWLGTPVRVGDRDAPGADRYGNPNAGWPHDAVGAVITGVMVAPDYRRRYANTSAPTDGTIEYDASGAAMVVNATAQVPVTVVLPRTAPPPEGWPVVIFIHGVPVDRWHMLPAANELARAGIATVGIDQVEMGLRASNRMVARDTTSWFPGTYRGPDGLADSGENPTGVIDLSASFLNGARWRDNIRQLVLDLVQLRRLVTNPALDLSAAAAQFGGTAPRLNPRRVAVIAESAGGAYGVLFAALEPDVDPVIINVAGGALLTTFGESPFNASTFASAVPLFGLPPANLVPPNRMHPFLNVAQMLYDPVDAASWAYDSAHPAPARPHNVLMVEVQSDEYISNRSTELLAHAMGLPQIAPNARIIPGLATVEPPARPATGPTRVLLLQPSAPHGANSTGRTALRTYETPFPREDNPAMRFVPLEAPLLVRTPVAYTLRAYVRFLQSGWAGGAEVDITGMPLFIDFDDDGWTDDEERSMSTNPFDPRSRPPGTPPHTWDPMF